MMADHLLRRTAVFVPVALSILLALLLGALPNVSALNLANGDFEAENISSLPAGSYTMSDSAASGSRALHVTQNGTVTKTTTTPAVNKITVVARGSQCNGAPNLIVKLDGTQIISTSVANTSYASFSASKSLLAGSHTVAISFTNDYWAGSSACDRNLILDRIEFTAATPPPTTTTTDTTNPQVAIISPVNGSTVSGPIIIQANASDNVGVIKVEFYINGVLKRSDTTAPYCMADSGGTTPCVGWDSKVLADGTHSLVAKAYDAASNTATSTISFTSKNTLVKSPPVVIADPAASGGSAVLMKSNGRAYKQTTTPEITEIMIYAKGDQCNGAPQMTIKFDGVQVLTIGVTATSYGQYRAVVSAAAGSHTAEVRFDNDYASSTCDRNLYLDKLEFRPKVYTVLSNNNLNIGTYMGPANVTGHNNFSAWLGWEAYVAEDFLDDSQTWYNIANNSNWLLDPWSNWVKAKAGRRMVIAMPMLNQASAGQLANGANGAFDSYFRTLAQNMVNKGLGQSVIRLGWEANGDWYPWRASVDQASWKAYYRRIVGIMRSVQPTVAGQPAQAFKFDLNYNLGNSGTAVTFASMYPGDDVVDYIGLDSYDVKWQDGWMGNPVATPDVRWNNLLYQPMGLNELVTFSRSHGKQMSIPEWGLWPKGTQDGGGGDNWHYIYFMANWIAANRSEISYQSYFNHLSGGSDGDHRLSSYYVSERTYLDYFSAKAGN